jgi:hypothetical protein
MSHCNKAWINDHIQPRSTPIHKASTAIHKEFKKMRTHRKSREPRTPAKLNRAVAVGAIATCTAGFGALAALAAPTAQADDWWLLSGKDNHIGNNATIFGTSGNGNTNQIGVGNGNIANGQISVPILSPVIAGGNAINAAPTVGGLAIGGAGTSAAVDVGIPVGGLALGTTLGLNPAIAGLGVGGSNLGTALGGVGLGGAAVPVALGGTAAQVATGTQANLNTPLAADSGQSAPQTVGGPTNATGGTNGDASSTGTGGAASNSQTAGAGTGGSATSGNTTGGTTTGGSATSAGTARSGTATGGAASGGSATSGANANAGGNQSNNTSTNNTSSGNGNNSSTSNSG